MSACLLELTLISLKVSEQGEKNTDRREEKTSRLHTQPTDVVELLSSLRCPLVSLQDAWWQRWGSKSCSRLKGGGSLALRVRCHGRAWTGPRATVSNSFFFVSVPYAPGHRREGTWEAVTHRPQLQSGDRACKGCPLSRLTLMTARFHFLSLVQYGFATDIEPEMIFFVFIWLNNANNLNKD